ncbi:MAG: glycosyltransferase family 2 protein [Deltaproteobacteria bacterium]|nr:glycosyltransferase family 2 protein [Deltaproteobacteria bacterium]
MNSLDSEIPKSANRCVTVVIPVYNEQGTIGGLVREIKTLYPDYDVLVVNDGSTDQSATTAKEAGAEVYTQPYNMGNGAAIKAGIRLARNDLLVFMDGDGQHDPKDIAVLIDGLSKYDMVVGVRPKGGQTSLRRSLGNKIYNWLASYVTRFNVQDLTSGFRAVKTEIARDHLRLLPNGYSYPTTLTLGALKSGRSISYAPINIRMRKGGKSKIKLSRDGPGFFMIILKIATLYSPLRIFIPVSLLMFGLGLTRYAYSYFTEGRFTNMSALLFITSVIIFMLGLISEQICQLRFERKSPNRIPKDPNRANQ